jgi:glycerol-3-phosphate cytidylyltransferase-like family protein
MKKPKRILIFVGCWVEQFVKDIKFFDYLENKLGCKVKKKSKFVFETILNNHKVIFQFCFGPDNDKIWKERKKIRAKERMQLPPSISHIVKKGIKTDEIYYLGFCGIFRGRKGKIYLPNQFIKINFNEYTLHHGHIDTIKVSKKIIYDNKLIGIVRGKKCTTVTSNQVLSLRYVKDKSEEVLKAISERLKLIADIVEMENYEIVKNFGKKHPIGIFLYGIDFPAKKGRMLGSKPLKINWRKFNKLGTKMINKITRK